MKISHTWYDAERGIMVVYADLPKEVDEISTINADGSYTVFIRATAAKERQAVAYSHALNHIRHCDFDDGVLVQDAERRCHAGIQTAT